MSGNSDLELLKALARALTGCNEAGETVALPIARITLAPIRLHGMPDAWQYCHSADLTADGLVEALKMLGALPAPAPARVPDDAVNNPEDAARFALQHGHLAAQLTDVFTDINPLDLQTTVLDHREADLPDVIQAIDDVLGDQYDSYADEDGDA